jgi:hypothetical protein
MIGWKAAEDECRLSPPTNVRSSVTLEGVAIQASLT